MIRRYAALAVLGTAILGLSFGCAPKVAKVEVKVMLDDKPAEGVAVSFISESTSATYAGMTDSSGVAKITAGTKDGVPEGSYIVTFTKTEEAKTTGDVTADMKARMGNMPKSPPPAGGPPGPGGPGGGAPTGPSFKSLIPAKYSDLKTSEFRYKVPEDSASVKEFKLSSSAK